jgi:hypothetical protein
MKNFIIRFIIIVLLYSILSATVGLAYSSLEVSNIPTEPNRQKLIVAIIHFIAPYALIGIFCLAIVLIGLNGVYVRRNIVFRVILIMGCISTVLVLISVLSLIFRVEQRWQGKINEVGSMAGAIEANLGWLMGYCTGVSIFTLIPMLFMRYLSKYRVENV